MITHFNRVRTDFTKEQAACLKRRRDDEYYDEENGDPPPVRKKCKLPEECDLCHKWICNACEKTVPWSDGGGETPDGGGAMLCDECWCKFLQEWLESEDKLEVVRMERYKQACAL